jgi:hypothetical protein
LPPPGGNGIRSRTGFVGYCASVGPAWTATGARLAAKNAAAPRSRSRDARASEILRDDLGGQHQRRVVLGRVLDLLEVVQTAESVDAVDRRDQPHRPIRVGIEMLVDGVGRNIDDVARLPLVALHLVLRLPVVGVGDFDVAVLVQVVAPPLEHVKAFFREVPVLPRAAAGRNDLHVSVHRLHARVHLLVEQVLQQPLARHLPRHILGAHDLPASRVARRLACNLVQLVLVEPARRPALQPRFRFAPGHDGHSGWL